MVWALQLGARMNERWEILRPVAESEMARVFLARDRETGRRVALKVLDAMMDPARFEREARVLASIDHPAIVRYVAHGTTDGKPWLATEWLEGEDLMARMDKGPLALDEILVIARAIAGALAYLHARGTVHRDVKPANIFLSGPTPRVRLLDFGIARDRSQATMTAANVVMGTPQYMAPEQAIDARNADARADVFALGAVLFHCVTGRPVFDGHSVEEIFAAIVTEPVPRMSSVVWFAPPELDEVVARATSRDPAARQPNGIALLGQLLRVPAASYCDDDTVTVVRRTPQSSGAPFPIQADTRSI